MRDNHKDLQKFTAAEFGISVSFNRKWKLGLVLGRKWVLFYVGSLR
jgi:hypothetical protein